MMKYFKFVNILYEKLIIGPHKTNFFKARIFLENLDLIKGALMKLMIIKKKYAVD